MHREAISNSAIAIKLRGNIGGGFVLKAVIVESVVGVLAFGEDNRIVDKVLFPKNAEKISEALGKIQGGEASDEVLELIRRLQKKGYTVFVFESDGLAGAVNRGTGVNIEVEKPSAAGQELRENFDKVAVELGFVKATEELHSLIREVSVIFSRAGIRRISERKDQLIAQTIQAIDELDKALNLFSSRIREWYGLHFPEMSRLVDKHETYFRLVADLGERSSFTVEELEKEGIPSDKAAAVADSAKTSMGADIGEVDLEKIRMMCRKSIELYNARSDLENYVDKTMEEAAPNITDLVGASLGARLIALAGGLENLAKMPASTVQVLGAEKALFRSIKTGGNPPKHGVIFQHPSIHSAQRWQRGKIARALAGKLSIASRVDAFSGKPTVSPLKTDYEKRVEEIQEKYKQPPRPQKKGRRPADKS